jgi:hypothetical protein
LPSRRVRRSRSRPGTALARPEARARARHPRRGVRGDRHEAGGHPGASVEDCEGSDGHHFGQP